MSAEPARGPQLEATGHRVTPANRQPGRLLVAVWHRLRSGLSSYRLRLLAWFTGLLAVGTVATVLVVGEVILQDTGERLRADLIQETQEFETLIEGTDPATGEPFGTDVARIFEVYLDRNVPARNEVILTFVDGEFHRRSQPTPLVTLEHEQEFVGLVASATAPVSGQYDSTAGTVDYLAIPVVANGEPRGVFVVAAFLDAARTEQDDIIRAVTTVGIILLVFGSLLAWRLADRVLAPVRRTAATARSIHESDLRQRVEVQGHDEVADLVLLAAATRPDFVRRTSLSARELAENVFEKARVLADRDWRLQSGHDAAFTADRQRLTQAILQLAQNAVQHTHPGDMIEVGVDADDAHVRLWVRDSGAGIPLAEQTKIFRRFYRFETQGRGPGGTGLGLSIVQAIAEAHGGRVELTSQPGAGATFRLVIPRNASSASGPVSGEELEARRRL